MLRSTDYYYVNEDSINILLKCQLCSKPFVDPVRTIDDKRICRGCIPLDDDNYENVTPMTEKIFLSMLDDLRVECIKCKETDIRRIDFEQHNYSICSKRIVSCKGTDLKCSWLGCYDELDHHLKSCPFELLRPILTDIINQNRISYNEQQREIQELKQQLTSKSEHDLIRQVSEQCNEIQQLKSQNEQYEKEINELKRHMKPLQQLYIQQINHNKKFEKSIELLEQLQTEFKQLSQTHKHDEQLQIKLDQLSTQVLKHDTEILQLQTENQNQKDDSLYIKQLSNQHDIQIKLLARRKCVIPTVTDYSNSKLEQLIENFASNSAIDLDGKLLNDRDMNIVCKKGIIDKKCQKLRLEENDITAKGAAILANVLFNNTTLTELYLSKNELSDMGVHALVQTLSINNSTLKCLVLHANNITDEGAEYLSEMLKTNKTIVLLGLGSNDISDYGIQFLTAALTYRNETLRQLYLSSNKLITDQSVAPLIGMLKYNPSLEVLLLDRCNLSRDAAIKLKQTVTADQSFILDV